MGVQKSLAAGEGTGDARDFTTAWAHGWRRLLRAGLRRLGFAWPKTGGPSEPRTWGFKHGHPVAGAVRRPWRFADRKASLDLPATVQKAALRGLAAGRRKPAAAGRFLVRPEDLRWASRPEPLPIDRCLLLDASASMAGERAEACRRMADFLLRNGGGRMAVVAFRGQEGQVLVGFTRSRRRLKEALAALRPGGLTPLASGLLLGLRLVRESRASPAQVILLTDGEPTKALWTSDAVADALQAAGLFRRRGVALVCCGLSGNEQVLAGLARESGGSFFVLRDFSVPSLLAVSRQLLGRISAGAAERSSRTGRGRGDGREVWGRSGRRGADRAGSGDRR